MKKMFRLWAVLLCLILTVTALPLPSFAQTEESADGLLRAVGAYDDADAAKADQDTEVTRAEAVYFALRLIGYSREAMNVYQQYYQDVPAEHPYAGAITLAKDMKLISPADLFAPDALITAEQLVRIVVSALGYDAFALLSGGYPTGYLVIAERIGLLRGFPAGDRQVPFRELTTLLDNALRSDVMEQTSFGGKAEFETRSGVTVLEKVYQVYEKNGQITQNDVTSLNARVGLSDNHIMIGGEEHYVSDRNLYLELSRHLGYEVTYFVRDDDRFGDPEIIYFEVRSNHTVTEIFSEDITSVSHGTIRYEDGKRTTSYQIPADANILYNGEALTEPLPDTVFDNAWGQVAVIENSRFDSVVVSVTAYENYVASAIDAESFIVYDKTAEGRKVDFSDNGKLSKRASFRSKTGETLMFDQISAESVLSVAAGPDQKTFEVIVVNETVAGRVGAISREQDENGSFISSVEVDANTYDVAPNLRSGRLAEIKPGENYVFGLDAGGRIASIRTEPVTEGGTVFLIDAKVDHAGVSNQLQFRILGANGKVSILDAAERIKIDRKAYKEPEDAYACLLADNEGGEKAVRSQPVIIDVNEDGVVTAIDTPTLASGEDGNNSLQVISAESRDIRYKSNPKMFESLFGIDGGTKVFFFPGETETTAEKGADEDYSVAAMSYFNNDDTYPVTAYAMDGKSPVASVLSVRRSKTTSIGQQAYLMVVDSVGWALTSDGDQVLTISGLYNGAKTTYSVQEDSVLDVSAATGTKPAAGEETIRIAAGDSIQVGQNSEGYVNEINLYYDFSEQKSYADNAQMDSQQLFQVVCGDLYYKKDSFITLTKDFAGDVSDREKRHFNANGFKIVVVEPKTPGKPQVRTGSAADLRDYYTYNGDCSRVLLQMRYFDPRTLVIYQK